MRYLEVRQLYCDMMFGWFLLSWFFSRHVLFLFAIASAILDPPQLLEYTWDPPNGMYLTKGSLGMFIICLMALQVRFF